MYPKRGRNICLIVMVILISSILGCGEGERGAHQEEESRSERAVIEAEQTEQEIETVRVTFVELGSLKCVPCKMMQPIIKEIEEEYKGQVKVVFHDVWTKEGNPYAVKYKIRVIPTQIFLDSNGREYFRHEGFFPKEDLVKVLEMQGVEL